MVAFFSHFRPKSELIENRLQSCWIFPRLMINTMGDPLLHWCTGVTLYLSAILCWHLLSSVPSALLPHPPPNPRIATSHSVTMTHPAPARVTLHPLLACPSSAEKSSGVPVSLFSHLFSSPFSYTLIWGRHRPLGYLSSGKVSGNPRLSHVNHLVTAMPGHSLSSALHSLPWNNGGAAWGSCATPS